MKNIRHNIYETGIIETSLVLNKHADDTLFDKAAMYMPIINEDVAERIKEIHDSIILLSKKKLLFLTPEIAIIEQFDSSEVDEIIICLPSDCNLETSHRIMSNMPNNINVTFITENEIPHNFTEKNSAIIAFGCFEGDRSLILNTNYRMMERYRTFYGYKVLASCGKNISGLRPVGWTTINTYEYFNEIL